MKPTADGSHLTGLVFAIIDLVVAWVVIVWLTRRLKRAMSADDK